jgi:pimeloyl-ACP methyl ester carboxylesterase
MPEIVEATTSDGIRLHGAYYPAPSSAVPSPSEVELDAVLLLHGAGGNFYGSTLFASLLPPLRQLGLAVLTVNTRGHDAVSSAATPGGVRMLGAAFETVDECRHDIGAWIGWLVQRGHPRVALAGHSLGAVKAIYSMALDGSAAVKRLIAMSPPRLAHSHFVGSPDADQFLGEYAEAERLVGEGKGETLMSVKFPIPYLVSAAGYVDKYGPAERYNVLKHVGQVTCPMLFTFGTIELRRGSAFQNLPEDLNDLAADKRDLKVAVIAGADHFYTAARSELAGQIESWLRRANRGGWLS